MTEIALRTYNQEIKDLIDHGHFDEAIAHCQHILETFPRHIETYRLLGKAFLEQGRHGDAADVFQRVLSAIPEDWLSHVAMAIVREDESNLDMAIWHMERAYEVNPSNTTVQTEVRRLRGRRDGVEPAKLRLTRSALARMYIKGGLFGQAIAEIRGALAEDSDRPDLQTLLASALFDSGAVQEATDICNAILQKLPYCLEANRIMGLALWASDKKEDAEKLFQRLESLDPYIDIDTLKKDKRIQEHPGQSITLTRIEWEQQEKTVRAKQPTWASSLGLKIEEPPAGRPAIPDWLATASQSSGPLTPAAPAAVSPFGGASPSWFNDAATAMGSGRPPGLGQSEKPAAQPEPAGTPAAKTGTGELPDWITMQSNTSESPPMEKPSSPLPDWLAQPSLPQESAPASSTPAAENAFPDWIRSAAPVSSSPADSGPGIPDWLSSPPPTSVDALPPSSLPEWTKPETKTGPLEVEPGNIPDWLSSSKPASSDVSAEPEWLKPQSPAAASDSIPEWMRGAAPAGASAAASAALDQVPDWLQDNPAPQSKPVEIVPEWMRPESAPAPNAAREKPAPLFAPETDIPEWMKPEPEPPAPAQPPPVPMQAPQPAVRPSVPEAAQSPHAAESAPEISLPDWITSPAPSAAPAAISPASPAAAAQPSPAEAEAAPESNLPGWLKATSAPSAQPAIAPTPVQPEEKTPEAEPVVTLPDWLTAVAPAVPAQPAPVPSMAASATPPPATPAEPVSEAVPEVTLPDWLTGLTPPAPTTPAPILPAPPIPSTPAPSVETPAQAIPEIALPDWLKGSAPAAPTIPSPGQSKPLQPPVTPPLAAAPLSERIHVPESQMNSTADVILPEWIRTTMPSAPAAPAPLPIPAAPEPEATQAPPQPAAQPVPAAQPPAPVEKPMEAPQPASETPIPNAISEGIELPDWLLAQLQGKPLEPTAPQATARPAVPLPDWLKPATQTPAPGSVVDWEKAAGQPVPSLPADATRPAIPAVEKTAAGPGEIPTWLDKSKPSGNETVARWLDRRLKTSTLSSLEDAIAKPGAKPPTAPPSARPAQSSTQLPTWLDSQKPGGSDTVVRWMDKRETGSLRKGPTAAFSNAGKGAFPAAEATPALKPNPGQFDAPGQPPASAAGTEDTIASRRPSTQEVPVMPRPAVEPARPVAPIAVPVPASKPPESLRPAPPPIVPAPAASPEEEEEEGAFVPPPEWLQKALGNAVAEVPPIPKEQPAAPEPAKPQPLPAPQATAPVVENISANRWQTPPTEEPAPLPSAKPAPWVPISAPQPVVETPVKPAKKTVKKKTRKLTDIESEAMIREARVYLETDLQKATDVYQQIIENPASAEVVAADLTTYLEQDPASPQLWNLLGDACSRAGRFQDAYKAYAEALRRM